MIHSGVISLYSRSGELLRQRRYEYPLEREKILNEWRRECKHLFNKMFFQICPDTDELLIDENGENINQLKDGLQNRQNGKSRNH